MVTQDYLCRKCTREGQTRATTSDGCGRIAHSIGWRMDSQGLVCANCPGGGKGNLSLVQAEIAEQERVERAAMMRFTNVPDQPEPTEAA